jgi:hypothetical protein
VPLLSIVHARTAEHSYPGVVNSLHQEGGLLLVGVSLRTDLEILLDRPIVLDTSQGHKTADRVGLWVDDPRADAAQLTAKAARGASRQQDEATLGCSSAACRHASERAGTL